jgi:hypothetical protein
MNPYQLISCKIHLKSSIYQIVKYVCSLVIKSLNIQTYQFSGYQVFKTSNCLVIKLLCFQVFKYAKFF